MADPMFVTKRKLTGAFFQSLDGVVQAPGGPDEDRSAGFRFGGWTPPFWDESMKGPTGRIFDEPEYDLLLGKRTYDIFSAFWPYNQDDPIGAKFQRTTNTCSLIRRSRSPGSGATRCLGTQPTSSPSSREAQAVTC